MPVVQMPDGTMVDVPDKPTPEQPPPCRLSRPAPQSPNGASAAFASDIGRGGLEHD